MGGEGLLLPLLVLRATVRGPPQSSVRTNTHGDEKLELCQVHFMGDKEKVRAS